MIDPRALKPGDMVWKRVENPAASKTPVWQYEFLSIEESGWVQFRTVPYKRGTGFVHSARLTDWMGEDLSKKWESLWFPSEAEALASVAEYFERRLDTAQREVERAQNKLEELETMFVLQELERIAGGGAS